MESRTAEMPFPHVRVKIASPSIAVPREVVRKAPEQRESILSPIPNITSALKFERAISIAIIVFGLMTISMISYHTLSSKFDARELRMTMQEARGEIGRYREEIQAAKGELGIIANSGDLLTLPIDPADVATVTLPLEDR